MTVGNCSREADAKRIEGLEVRILAVRNERELMRRSKDAAEARIAELEAALRAVALSAGCCDACPCHMTATRKARAALGEKKK